MKVDRAPSGVLVCVRIWSSFKGLNTKNTESLLHHLTFIWTVQNPNKNRFLQKLKNMLHLIFMHLIKQYQEGKWYWGGFVLHGQECIDYAGLYVNTDIIYDHKVDRRWKTSCIFTNSSVLLNQTSGWDLKLIIVKLRS